jgi:hypothetical protein
VQRSIKIPCSGLGQTRESECNTGGGHRGYSIAAVVSRSMYFA